MKTIIIHMATKNPNKRPYNDSDSDSDSTPWPRFLIIESVDKDMPLQKLSPFAINKGIMGIAGQPASVKKLRSGHIMVEVTQKSHSTNLLKTTNFVNIPVKVSRHRTLNSKKGVIRCPDLKECSDEEILDELASQGIIHLQRFHVTCNGIKVPTGILLSHLIDQCYQIPYALAI